MWYSKRTAKAPETRVHIDDREAARQLGDGIYRHMDAYGDKSVPVTIVCIGSDRSTGDALGPLVGTRLAQRIKDPRVRVEGTLEKPIHAANLNEHLERIHRSSDSRLLIAVDACLGRSENVGTACVKSGPLKPGAGVNKALPHVGHFHVIGVVNVGGFMEYFVLQNTRLNLVVRLSEVIADGIELALERRLGGHPIPQVAAAIER